MRFSVGWQQNDALKKSILDHTDAVREVYFPWGKFTTGRGTIPDPAMQTRLEADLKDFRDAGLALNLLLNGNCYGKFAQERGFFQEIGDQTEFLIECFGLSSVTTTSPLIARFLKENFPELEIRASVNMEIGTPEGVEYLLPWFDSFYLKREYNYDPVKLKQMRQFTQDHGKKLFLLANSGCLNFCSARTFHDNLVAHQHEIAQMDNALDFLGACHLFLKERANREVLLQHTNFIRPENIAFYEPYCDGCKLATRTNRNPADVVEAYSIGHWSGNLLELTEPAHAGSMYPNIILNEKITAEWFTHRMQCGKDCLHCGFCNQIQQKATVNLEDRS